MALKDRFRRAIGRSDDRSSSTSSASTGNLSTRPPTGTTTPVHSTETPLTATSTNMTGASILNNPPITLTKTSSRLSKTLTWRSTNNPSKQEAKERKALEEWKKKDAEEWREPKSLRPGKKNQKCQETLRAFEWKFGRESMEGGRSRSMCSGISPSASRVGSVDDGSLGLQKVLSGGRKRSSGAGAGPGKLSQELTTTDGPSTTNHKQNVGTVQEE